MATLIARNDADAIPQVDTLTPTVTNSADYSISMNTKLSQSYTSDGSATAQEIVEGLQALLDAEDIPEIAEVTWTEDNAKIIATGPDDGTPFTIVDNGTLGALTVATVTTAQSKNHWIAENFDTGDLPASGDTVTLSQLSVDQSFKYNLDQNAVALAVLDIRQDCEAEIGLPEFHESGYYQPGYRDTHLSIETAILRIGQGSGQGSRRIKLNLGTGTATAVTIFNTASNPADNDEACVHLSGSNAGNTLTMIKGIVDLAMLPGTTASFPVITVNGGRLRCGPGCGAVTTLDVGGTAVVETRSAITTLYVRDNTTVTHIGSANITTANVLGSLKVVATGALTIATLNGYSNNVLDLSEATAAVTVTNMNVYGTPDAPFRILDPNNKLTMTNAASTPNGAGSLVVVSGSGRNVRVT